MLFRSTSGLGVGPAESGVVEAWTAAGWAILEGNRIVLTPTGWLRLDSLATTLSTIPPVP